MPAFLGRAVVGQQLSTKAARTIWSRVEAAALAAGVGISEFFEEANVVALRSCGLSANKVKSVLAIRAAERAGTLDSPAIHAMDHLARSEHLAQIHGIGQWTCDMASIFYCHDPDVWPEGDLAVQRVFARYIGRRKPARAAANFAPHRSLLALYMWRLVDAVPSD